MSLTELSNNLLNKYGCNLSELASMLPSGFTTGAHILEGDKRLTQGNLEEAFHELSLSHSTLLYHRQVQKAFRANSTSECSKENLTNNEKNLSSSISSAKITRPSSAEGTMNMLKNLPADWTVVQVTCEGQISGEELEWKLEDSPPCNPNMIVSRATCGPSPSLIVQKIPAPSKKSQVVSYVGELTSIRNENKIISKDYLNSYSKYVSKREEINNRMKQLVKSMEIAWLQHWSCLFQGTLNPPEEKKLMSLIKKVVEKHKLSLSEEKLNLLKLMTCFPPPLESKSSSNMHDIVETYSLIAGVAAVLESSLKSSQVCAITKSLQEVQKQIISMRKSLRNPLILILDKTIVPFPWEMLFVMKNQSVTRMPSLHSLYTLYLHHSQKEDSLLVKGIDPSSGFYVLDPDNNLPNSQERLKDSFKNTKWPGITGRKPTADEFKEALTSKDIFMYTGHGSGSQYMPGNLVEQIDCRSLVLLYGCSSVGLKERGPIADPFGTVFNYLIAHCPCVVGMLWQVMDKDTDILNKEMLRAIIGRPGPPKSPLEDPPTDLALLVARARPLCSWYLISCSLVVYGLPLHIVSNAN